MKKRKFHALRTAEKLTYPQHLLFIDTETTTIKHDEEYHEPKLVLGVVEYIRLDDNLDTTHYKRRTFRDLDTLYDFIESSLAGINKCEFYAHNWSFDLPVIDLFNRLPGLGFKMLAIIDASPPTIIRYSREGCRLTIIDSLNYFMQSLASMGKVIGLEKLDIELDGEDTEDLETYCRRDVEILRESIINLMRFLKDNQLTRLTHTVSSLALSTFVRKFLKAPILIDGNEKRNAVGRSSYFGGRTECFRLGKYEGEFHMIDVNSQYPHVMRNFDYPIKSVNHYTLCELGDLRMALKKYCVTAECTVEIDEPYLPYKINGRTCFPIGKFRTFLSSPEIAYGLDKGFIRKVHQMVLHEKSRVFAGYVEYFYKKRIEYRKAENNSYEELCKKFLNTLYGKFGQQAHEWAKCDEPRKPGCWKWFDFDMDTMTRSYYMYIDKQVWRSDFQVESRDSFPAIAAHVTAEARMLIWRTIMFVGRENVIYCDTDSLLLTKEGYQKIEKYVDNDTLGCWGYVDKYSHINIRGAKDYVMDSVEKIKGVRKSKLSEYTSEDEEAGEGSKKPLYGYIKTKTGAYRQLQFTNLKGTIRSGKMNTPVIRHIEKNLSRIYYKGDVHEDGSVSPFVL